MSLILKIVFVSLFWMIWFVLGFFYWILILGRIVVFIGVELLSALFSQGEAPNLSPLVEGSSMIYIDGFVRIYEAFFGGGADPEERKPLLIGSFYELLTTIFIAYLMFALVFPGTLLPDVSRWIESAPSVQSANEIFFDFRSVALGAVIALFFAFIFLVIVAKIVRSEDLENKVLVRAVLNKNVLSEEQLREISDEINVSLPDLKESIRTMNEPG